MQDAATDDMEKSFEDPESAAGFRREYERLRDGAPGYEFNDKIPPFHSSYDNWHFFGRRRPKSFGNDRKTSASSVSTTRPFDYDVSGEEEKEKDVWVIGRLSKSILRLEREFKLCQRLFRQSTEDKPCFVRPLDFFRLPARHSGEPPLCVNIVEAPGPNYLRDVVEFGSNFYWGNPESPHNRGHDREQVTLLNFLDFSIGATECLEILHHGNDMVHGELRGDAFHFNKETGVVRMINFGSGIRSFEHGLTSANWSTLTAQRGVEHKLQFIAPEQTGRLPAEPDARTDIYSLGILFWWMLTDQAPFDGKTPLDIMTMVLSRRIPSVSTIRPDIPDALSKVIAKMTARNMDDRYNSSSGIKHDMQQLKRILTEGDQPALAAFKVATADVSCFFNLPSNLVGREEQRATLIGVIEKAAKRSARRGPVSRKGLYSISSASSIMAGDRDRELSFDGESDATSSTGRDRGFEDGRLGSIPEIVPPHDLSRMSSSHEQHGRPNKITSSTASTNEDYDGRTPDHAHSSRASIDGLQKTISSVQFGSEPSSLLRTAQKLRGKGRTELIGICGAAGFGKSALVQSIQGAARKHGYFTQAKFDSVRSAPFDPVIRIMSALLRQIFSENDVNTPFHDNIRTFVKPFWGVLHAYLELPLWLLSPTLNGKTHTNANVALQNGSLGALPERKMCNAASTQEWLRSGGSNKSSRFLNVFVDVLRLLAVQKFVCFCLDDLQFADSESLELIHLIDKAHIPIVLMVTYRAYDQLTPATQRLLDKATIVEVGSFTDEDTANYVSHTLHRPLNYCTPLVAVVQEKTQGNPFFVREMLDSAYRKKCIYYCWKCSHWEFSLDKLFEEFSSPDTGKFSTNDFILRRMRDLPVDAQALLAWAAILGNSFQFNSIKRVMSCACSQLSPQPLIPPTSQDPVAGLQSALQSFVIMPTENEDRFKFSHDRYIAAASILCDDFDRAEMHYVIATSTMKHDPYDPVNQPNKILFEQARHVSQGLAAVKLRAKNKYPYRDLLYQAAETARESGASRSGLSYFQCCLELLPENPWNDPTNDATYGETLTLKTRAAEAYWYCGEYEDASKLLCEIFERAHNSSDKAPAAIIHSRMHVQLGDSNTAFYTLKHALADLGLDIPAATWDECDDEFQSLVPLLENISPDAMGPRRVAPDLTTLGALLTEFQSSAYWTDHLLYYQATLTIMRLFLERGVFAQAALGYVNLAALAANRFSMVQSALAFGQAGLKVLEAFPQEHFVIGRTLTLYSLFIGHLRGDMQNTFQSLNTGLEAASTAGDKIGHLLNIGILVAYRLWTSDNVDEILAFISSVSDEFPEYPSNFRGGVFLIGTRQYARALSGKTHNTTAVTVLDDDTHSSEEYEQFLMSGTSNPDRALSIFRAYRLLAMYQFGHYREALEFGKQLVPLIDGMLCMRHKYTIYFAFSLAIVACIREDPDLADKDELMKRVAEYRARCGLVASVGGSNSCFVFVSVLDAETADAEERYGEVLGYYEAAVNHAVLNSLTLDEAISLEHYGDWLSRRGAARPARGIVLDAISAYRRVGAFGKADHVHAKYEFLLYGTRSLSAVDAGTQTTAEVVVETSYADRLESMASHQAAQTPADRTVEWLEPQRAAALQQKAPPAALSSAVGLDMIDLAGILESSQLLSSELNVDRLLQKLTTIILDSTGADLAGLVVESDIGEWCIACVKTAEGIDLPEENIPLNEVEDPVARQVTLYVLRFKEQLFLENVLNDERFSNVPDTWLEKYPEGASMVSIPILHGDNVLLGSIYCQAPPNSFTERTVTLLKLLVNQIAISIANALLFKRSENVQASNIAMLEVQKQALSQAREAEKKAKAAEANAMESVRQKEEAAKAKSMFLANVSHELRTPLNGVIGMSEMLKATELNKEQEGHADSIRVCADTLLSVINDILDFSKLEAGKMQVFSVPVSLVQSISEVIRALSYTNLEKNIETFQVLDLDPKLIVMGDPVRLHQVLMNLLSNAYKFTARGSVTVRAKVDSQDADSIKVTVSVTDTGIGIDKEKQKKLFLPFSQADSSTARSYGGTGLGLSICKAIVENVMHGKIWLESKPDEGTTVSFSLPFKKANPSKMGEQSGRGGGTTPHGRDTDPMSIFTPPAEDDAHERPFMSLRGIPRDQLKVCIAEDNLINQRIAISFVKKLGLNCEAYGDGQQAYDALTRAVNNGHPFHLVLMDVQMPVLDGYNATREIRKHSNPIVRDILIIAMTASAIRGDREKCLEAGMNNYLAKPVRVDTLKQMLERYLQSTKPGPEETGKLITNNNKISADVGDEDNSNSGSGSGSGADRTPVPGRANTTSVHLTAEELAKKPLAQANMQAQIKAVEQELKELQESPSKAAVPSRPKGKGKGKGKESRTNSATSD